MKWLEPAGLALFGLAVPLVLLYVLKVRRVRRRVASTWLWAEARRELAARAPWKRLVPQVPLFLQLAALLALALAAARPTTSSVGTRGEHLAIVLDTSASMGAKADGSTRLDAAKRIAHDLVDGLAPGGDVLILDAGKEPRLATPPERDRRRLHAAIDGLSARDVEGDLGTSVALAVQRLAQGGGSRRIVVLTDGALARPATFDSPHVPIEVVRVGTEADNAGIVRVDVRSGDDPVLHREQVQAFLLIENFSSAPRELFVTMKERGASDTLASRKVTVAPSERLPVVLTFAPAPGDRGRGLEFELAPHDALLADDVAFARVPEGRSLPVALVTNGPASPWLERVLAADADVTLTRHTFDGLARVPEDAFVVLDGACPSNVPGGDAWIVNPPEGPCFGAHIGGALESPRITSWEDADPRLRFLSLDDLFVGKARRVEAEAKRQELVRTDRGAVVCDASTGSRQVTVLGFDVADTDWPYKASFVVFARNLLEQARLHRTNSAIGAKAGDAVRAPVPLGVTRVSVQRPGDDDASASTLSARGGIVVLPEAERVGLYRVAWKAPTEGSVLVPVNLTSEAESDLRRTLERTPSGGVIVDGSAAVASSKEHGVWFAVLALAFVLVEAWWFTRGRQAARRHIVSAQASEAK